MLKKNISRIVFSICMFCCFFSVVSARTCVYEVLNNVTLDPDNNDSVSVNIYDDDLDKKPHTDATTWGEDIKNWGEKVGGFDAKEYYKKTGKCPNYLIYDTFVYNMGPTLYFSDSKHLKDIEDAEANVAAEFDIYNLISPTTDIETEADNSDEYVCNYSKFILYVDDIKKDIETKSHNATITGFWNVSDALKEYWFGSRQSSGCIKELYYCTTVNVSGQADHNIYTDITQAALESDSLVCNCVGLNGKTCSGNGECPSFVKYTSDISQAYEKYSNCGNSTCKTDNLSYANSKINELKIACKTMLENLDSTEPCAKNCLLLENSIKTIKQVYNISEKENNGECGFSGRLLSFFANILRWIKYILPVVAIVLGILDFMKAMGAEKQDEMKKAQGRFVKRLIAATLLFIVPLILEFVLDKMGFGYDDCGLF